MTATVTPPPTPTPEPLQRLDQGLADLAARGLSRSRRVADTPCAPRMRLDGRDIVAFASNDYLGLANDARIIDAIAAGARKYGAGSGGSHLLGGHARAHAVLEDALAEFAGGFTGNPRALSFSTGYMANMAILTALGGREGTIYSDALNHASLIDGARLSRARVRVYPHGDVAALAAMLASDRGDPPRIIVTDAVFSMDGDIAPLAALLALAERHQAWLVVDDAHGFGVHGHDGAGTVAALGLRSSLLVYMGTLGKAAGVAGAFVVAQDTVIEWLVQRARSYIFTTASAPALAHAATASIALLRSAEGSERRRRLRAHIDAVRAEIRTQPFARRRAGEAPPSRADADSPLRALPPSTTAIQPILVGGNEDALALADALLGQGLWVPAVRPPTVPPGTARLRLSLSAAHDANEIARLLAALAAFRGAS